MTKCVILGIIFAMIAGCAALSHTPVHRSRAEILAAGPPPGYVAPQNYWVREKIILR